MIDGQALAILCHPSRRADADEFAAQVAAELGTNETLAVVADDACPRTQVFVVNRDYFDRFSEQPWKVMYQ